MSAGVVFAVTTFNGPTLIRLPTTGEWAPLTTPRQVSLLPCIKDPLGTASQSLCPAP